MSCFTLPGYLLNSIESAFRNFWWGNGSGRKLAWTSWKNLCKPKRFGGLGFRDLRSFNLALLAKQCWRLTTNPESLLGRVFKAKYFPYTSFLEARLGSRPSATWRSILQARPVFAQGIRIRVGNGFSTSIWEDAWIPEAGNFRVIQPPSFPGK